MEFCFGRSVTKNGNSGVGGGGGGQEQFPVGKFLGLELLENAFRDFGVPDGAILQHLEFKLRRKLGGLGRGIPSH